MIKTILPWKTYHHITESQIGAGNRARDYMISRYRTSKGLFCALHTSYEYYHLVRESRIDNYIAGR